MVERIPYGVARRGRTWTIEDAIVRDLHGDCRPATASEKMDLESGFTPLARSPEDAEHTIVSMRDDTAIIVAAATGFLAFLLGFGGGLIAGALL